MNDVSSSTAPRWAAQAQARLAHMSPAWFVLVMGWCGLSQAWLRSEGLLGEMAAGIGLVAAGFALLAFSLLSLASVVRLHRHPSAVQADLLHPVRHAFMATFPISVILLATLGVGLFGGLSPMFDRLLTVVWVAGSVLELWATLWVLGRWLRPKEQGGLQWPALTPVLFIPVVGNVLAPLAGVPLGLGAWASAQLGVGLFLWPVLLVLLIVRLVQAGPLPQRMTPTLFVTLAPPSVIGLSLMVLDAPTSLVWGVWGVGVFFLGWALTQVRAIREQAFGMPHWGMSFPCAAFTALTLRLAQTPQGAWLHTPALILLAATSLLILGLTLNTWHGLRNGSLLLPEQ